MKRAIISDIHANLEALEAVLAHVATLQVDQLICLGDVIGYGPNPAECLDLVMKHCDLTILGNHDQAAIFDPEGFNPIALRAIFWTRDQMEKVGDHAQVDKRWDFIGELPRRQDEGEYLLVHGSPRDPVREYMVPRDAADRQKMGECFAKMGEAKLCFVGHSHIPGVYTEDLRFLSPGNGGAAGKSYVHEAGKKALINVGSVGQPRDGDPRASYVITDGKKVTFFRLDYDVKTTMEKIYATPGLPNYLADRLVVGR